MGIMVNRGAIRGAVAKWGVLGLAAGLLSVRPVLAETDETVTDGHAPLWEESVGSGFRKGTTELALGAGAGIGLPVLQSVGEHNWAIGILDYGWMISGPVAKDHWWRGNWELLADLFGGYQFQPEGAYFVGLSPHLRYNFATGSRWMPFLDVGAGATATDIREPDLSTTFEFNLQGGGGIHYFLQDDMALTFQWRFIHFSNAGIKYTNLGVNNSTFLLGISEQWAFQMAAR